MAGEASSDQDPDELEETEFVEKDPTGRYGRYREILGKGAFKTVYKAFDEVEGIEVAWNQVKVADLLGNAEDMDRLYSEVHLLKTLKHENIIKFYNSWLDSKNKKINFITEVFTSGTLRQYRTKHKKVAIRAVKKWSRQILRGLLYLHSHDPPVIHRDLKCDNIFLNGNQGEVKIGDLGLAAILRHAHSAHSVIGTPEFMAPELYEEEYNELVDIYAFGMCLLELVTLEYPYAECANAAQIYKKVTSGVRPASLGKIKDREVREFIEKCIANASERLSASQLLMDPFLQLDEKHKISSQLLPLEQTNSDNLPSEASYAFKELVPPINSRDFTVQGQRKDMNTIFLKLRIADSTGQVRNIHFPFNIEADTSVGVATEMVAELDLTNQDVMTIAAMIDTEIHAYVPGWMSGEAPSMDKESEATFSDTHSSEAEDELSPLSRILDSRTGALFLDRFPSGKKYWSDSPRGSGECSPSSHTGFNASECNKRYRENNTASKVEDNHENDKNQREGISPSSLAFENQTNSSNHSKGGEGNLDVHLSALSCNSRGSNSSSIVDQDHLEASLEFPSGADREEAYDEQTEDQNHAFCGSLLEDESDDVRLALTKLENMVIEQQKELEEVRKKHAIAIADFLKGLPPQLQSKTSHIFGLKAHDKLQKLGGSL